MIGYWFRKIWQAIPIIIGVNIITFLLFFIINDPTQLARKNLGNKHVSQESIQLWLKKNGYDLPLFYNQKEKGIHKITQTLFFTKNTELLTFHFGKSDSGQPIIDQIKTRMWPSLQLAIPTLIIGVSINMTFALFMALFHQSWFDRVGIITCIVIMSISSLFYIIGGQFFISSVLKLTPVSGYESGFHSLRFLILPTLIGVLGGIGSGSRWYRTLFLEEMNKGYVRTAQAKGCSDFQILYKHVLRNALIPILTGLVVLIPSLFLGSLIIESFFGIPGLGSYTTDAILSEDFAIVRVMVYIGTITYIIGLLCTDASYLWADPRVRLNKDS